MVYNVDLVGRRRLFASPVPKLDAKISKILIQRVKILLNFQENPFQGASTQPYGLNLFQPVRLLFLFIGLRRIIGDFSAMGDYSRNFSRILVCSTNRGVCPYDRKVKSV